jgi:signal transduction histidine kinase
VNWLAQSTPGKRLRCTRYSGPRLAIFRIAYCRGCEGDGVIVMSENRTDPGFGLFCSVDGIVTRIVYDGLGLAGRIKPGCSFSSIFEPGSIDSSVDFLRAVQSQKNIDDWGLDMQAVPLHFWGVLDEGRLNIAGGLTRDAAAKIGLNLLQKKTNGHCDKPAVQDRHPYEELSSLNNEFMRTQRELVKRNLQLEALHQDKTRWLAMAAHDLRHPLSAILVNCELLIEEAATFTGEQRTLLESTYSSCQCMLQLLDDVLDMSAVVSGTSRFSPESTDIRSLLAESVALCRPLADRKETRIDLQFQEPIPAVTLDRQKIRQVFLNLIGNAIKYSQRGATVHLRVAVEGKNALFSVQDNGPGIPPDELLTIFKPFQKTRARAAAAEPGTGLGLAICKLIVERHGGRIWAESTPGQGAAFHISLAVDVASNRKSRAAEIS